MQLKGIAHITTDEWGASIRFESEGFRTLSLSGRWDVITCNNNRIGAHYAGWTLSFMCPYPEPGDKLQLNSNWATDPKKLETLYKWRQADRILGTSTCSCMGVKLYHTNGPLGLDDKQAATMGLVVTTSSESNALSA